MRASILLAAIIFLTSCGTRTVYVTTPLEVPPRPPLPGAANVELSCLTDATYVNLVRRDLILRNHIETLEGIIQSTQE